MSIETADLLASSREYIEENGWVQDELIDEETNAVCSVGAMVFSKEDEFVEGVPWGEDVLAQCSALARSLDILAHTPEICTHTKECTCVISWVTNWNDWSNRTVQEVLDAFAKAEKIERAGFDPDAA